MPLPGIVYAVWLRHGISTRKLFIAEGLLRAHARIGKRVGKEARSLCVNDFPYSLIYLIESEEIIVVAVAHHSRRPDHWLNRLQEQG